MYCAIEPQADEFALSFCEEAEELWRVERDQEHDSTMSLSATVFLCMGYLGQGRDHSVLKYLAEVTEMGTRMGLFGVKDGKQKATPTGVDSYAAWGVFNWTV